MQGRNQQDTSRTLEGARGHKPDDEAQFEAELEAGTRKGGVPPQYTVGGSGERVGTSASPGDDGELEGQETHASGADVAPTEKAAERERRRHELERQAGRAPAGHDGKLTDHRSGDVSRADLDEAARQADREIAGRELPHKDS